MPDSVYLDACIFIEVLQKDLPGTDAARVDACCDLIVRAEKKQLLLVTSAWTIAEVHKLDELGKTGVLLEDQSKKILDFLENEYIVVRQLDRGTAELAHKLTRTHGLGHQDAVHVATALLSKGVGTFYTYDRGKGRGRKGLLKHDGKVGGKPPLRIECPPAPTGYPLFDKKPGDEPPAPPLAGPNGSTRS